MGRKPKETLYISKTCLQCAKYINGTCKHYIESAIENTEALCKEFEKIKKQKSNVKNK